MGPKYGFISCHLNFTPLLKISNTGQYFFWKWLWILVILYMLYVLYLTSCDVISAIFDIAHIGWLLHGVVVFVAIAQKTRLRCPPLCPSLQVNTLFTRGHHFRQCSLLYDRLDYIVLTLFCSIKTLCIRCKYFASSNKRYMEFNSCKCLSEFKEKSCNLLTICRHIERPIHEDPAWRHVHVIAQMVNKGTGL